MKCYGQGRFIAMYQIDDKFYRLNMFDHELEVGKMIFDFIHIYKLIFHSYFSQMKGINHADDRWLPLQ